MSEGTPKDAPTRHPASKAENADAPVVAGATNGIVFVTTIPTVSSTTAGPRYGEGDSSYRAAGERAGDQSLD